jgi:hypothetical protein
MNYITIKIPEDARVLLLEDSPMRITWFKKRIPNLTVVSTVEAFKAYFQSKPICDFVFYDHDLGDGNGNGAEAAAFMSDHFGGTSSAGLIHSWNRAGAMAMQAFLPNTSWIPFGQFEVEA